MNIVYPWSRISTRNCPTCRLHQGQLIAGELVTFPNNHEMLPVTCDYCGYTMWFDLTAARQEPYQDNSSTEEFPYS